MIAGNGDAVAYFPHQLRERGAFCHRADGLAPGAVTVVHEDHVIALRLESVSDFPESGVSDALVDTAVDVAGVEDHNAPFPAVGRQKALPAVQHIGKPIVRHMCPRPQLLSLPFDDPVHHCSLHRLVRPARNLPGVGEAQREQPFALGSLSEAPGVAIQHRDHLFQRHGIIGAEASVAVPVDDSSVRRPSDRLSQRAAIRNIDKGTLNRVASLRAAQPEQFGDKFSPVRIPSSIPCAIAGDAIDRAKSKIDSKNTSLIFFTGVPSFRYSLSVRRSRKPAIAEKNHLIRNPFGNGAAARCFNRFGIGFL